MTAPLNASDAILARAREPGRRDRPAIRHAGGTVTCGELDDAVSRAANALASLGLARGERVCLLMNDSPRFCTAFLGALKAGAVAVALNTRLPPAELAYIVGDCAARLAIADPDHLAAAGAACHGTATRLVPALGAAGSLAAAMAAAGAAHATAPTRADDPAFWLYSSGTTGKPKAIVHSHASCAHAGKLLREVVGAGEDTVVLATSKLFFAYALDNGFIGALACGGTIVLDETWPAPSAIAANAARYRPNVFFTVPTVMRRLLALPPGELAAFAPIPLVFTAGERLPDAIAAKWRAAVGTTVLEAYGMSETFCNAFANFPGRHRAGTCGVPLADVQAKLLDESGHEVPDDAPGVLWVKHPSLASGYQSAAATTRAFRDGWFCTGDLFTRDADGYWSHQGRADELYKIAGQWVKPAEVEEAVLVDTRIREAACVVVPDGDGFDRLALFVVGVHDDAAAAAVARLDELPRHARPKWVRAVPELPRTATGKVQRFRLREQLVAELREAG
jgi:3-hydroxybenzoate/4-hydroxybenzoate---CoA ligase